MHLRHLAAAASVAATLLLAACGDSGKSTGPTIDRAALALQLSNISASLYAQAPGTTQPEVRAAAILAAVGAGVVREGADLQKVGDYYVVAYEGVSDGPPASSEVTLIAWKNETDLVVSDGTSEGTVALQRDVQPVAFAEIVHAPDQVWTATSGTMTVNRTGVGGSCALGSGFDLPDGRHVSGTCNLATYTVGLNITGSEAGGAATTGTPLTFSLAQHTVGGIYITNVSVTPAP